MGRAPASDTTEQCGKRAMLDALNRITIAMEDGSMEADDFYFKFATAQSNKQSGRCNKSSRMPASYEVALESEILIEVEAVFQDVDDGVLEEEGYYFELTTPHFSFTSGGYPPQKMDGCTLLDDEQESIPCSLESHFSKLEDVWKTIPSLIIKELKEIKWMRPPGSIKEITGHLNGSCLSITFVFTLVVCVMVVHTGASPIAETKHPLTLTAGKDGTIPFECSNDHQSDGPKYYTVTFEGKERPFYLDGALDPEGLMSPDQFERFRVDYVENDSAMSIEIHISSVSLDDQGTYIVMVIIPGEIPEPRLMTQVVIIYIPPGPAACFVEPSTSVEDKFEVHCNSKRGNGDSTLTCFQKGGKIPYIGAGDQIVYRRAFWLSPANGLVSCCAHDIEYIDTITEASCKQFTWPKTHVTNIPHPTEKVPPDMALATRNSSNDDEVISPPIQTTEHSGCSQRFNIWQKAMLPLMAIVARACMLNL